MWVNITLSLPPILIRARTSMWMSSCRNLKAVWLNGCSEDQIPFVAADGG